jgi:hypothetical protein
MHKKMFLLLSAVLVLTIIDTVWADPCDANLIGWWKFDEGAGTAVADSSAYGNDGVTVSAPTWVGGCPIDPCDSAMYFDGIDDYVLCAQRDGNTYPAELMPAKYTISCWVKLDSFEYYGAFVSNGADGACGFFLQHGGNGNDFGLSLFTEGIAWSDVETPAIYETDLWYHLAATYDGQDVNIYVDGDLAQADGVSGPMRWIRAGTGLPPDNFVIGSWQEEGEYFPIHGTIDEVRFYNYAMPQSDIAFLAGFLPGMATNPSPRRGANNVLMEPTLSWTAGTGATAHAVYFGTNADAVENATSTDTTGIYKGTQAMPDVDYIPGSLVLDKTYYWRIDAKGAVTIKGRVWSFTVAPFNLVDDFESYANTTALEAAWNDYWYGPGHTNHGYVFKNTDTAFSRDGNSMMFTYSNGKAHSGTYYGSWATGLVSKIPVGNDWTAGGVKALVLYFYGKAGNSKTAYDRMYVKLTDGAAHTGVLRLPDMNDVAEEEWHEWNIELADPAFSTVVKTNVTSIRIGFGGADGGGGNKAGAAGTMYFDDIRLWPPRCRQEIAYPYGDATGDCSIDESDIGVMSDDWLNTDSNIMATAPPDANLIGWWKFDEGEGNTVEDSSAYNNTGVSVSPTPTWTTGYPYDPCNSARYFDGLNNYYNVVCAKRVGTAPGTYPPELRPGKFTISVWAKFVDYDEDYAGLVTNGADGACGFFLWNCTDSAGKGTGDFGMSMMTAGGWQDIMPTNVYPANTWNHIAATYDGQYANFYVNGIRTAGPQDMYGAIDWLDAGGNYPNQFVIGAFEDPGYESLVHGSIDEVRYYNYALPHAQIAVLAGLQGSIYLPLESPANFVRRVPDPAVDPHYYPNNPDIVNFLDYHVIAENWLNQILWP